MSNEQLTIDNDQLPKGYKQTEVGVIPEDWRITNLGEVANIIDPQPDHRTPPETNAGEPYIGISDFINDIYVDWNNCRRVIPKALDKQQKSFQISPGDIIFGKIGTIGFPKFVPNTSFRYALSANVILLKPKVEPYFLMSWLKSNPGQQQINKELHSTSQAAFGILKMRDLLIALPPTIEEQRSIATALSDVDALIASLDKLIAKKRSIKTATMQQLLTGKKRLPGFGGEWEVKRLGDLAHIQRGASPRPIDSPIWFDSDSSVGWVRISDVTCSGMYLYVTEQKLSPLGIQHSRPVSKDNLIMSICATVGRPIITAIDVCIHDGFVVFNSLQADQLFMYYILQWIEPSWSKQGQTGSQMNLNTELINSTVVCYPSATEQRSIATVLSDMDAEIAALEARRAKTQAIKHGMMQELLTGRTRLV
jgi:type I restriction enzyme, S subunit